MYTYLNILMIFFIKKYTGLSWSTVKGPNADQIYFAGGKVTISGYDDVCMHIMMRLF